MKQVLAHIVASAMVLVVASGPLTARAQVQLSPIVSGEVLFSPWELDQLVAPIALYPDQLLGQVLMASTYPFEVVQAARWVNDPGNAQIRGAALSAALSYLDWDPSVKSLVPFPQVLQMMDTHLDWMQRLGDAFLAQEGDVMDAVQRLRRRALADGRLRSTAQQIVIADGGVIVIETATPDVIYVPYYDPYIVYGDWPYPAYPPYYFPPPPSYYVESSVVPGFFFFAGGVVIVNWLWKWHHWDWHRHRIHLDLHRYNVINVRRPPIKHEVWLHDHYHRRGVPYPSAKLQKKYERPLPPAPATRREYRGYEPGAGVVPPAVRQPQSPRVKTPRKTESKKVAPSRTVPAPGVAPLKPSLPATGRAPRQVPRKTEPRPSFRKETPKTVTRKTPPSTRITRAKPATRQTTPKTAVRREQPAPKTTRSTPAPRVTAPKTAVRRQAPAKSAVRRTPPAFEGFPSGSQARKESERGRESRAAKPNVRSAPRSSPPTSRRTPDAGSRRQSQPRSNREPAGKTRR